jgi:hypothetical protein
MWNLLHTLALLWMAVGLGAVVVPIWRAWGTHELEAKALLLSEAQQAEARWLLPGLLAVGLTGFAWATAEEPRLNLIRTGWLAAKEVIFIIDVFIFLPLMGVGLRRVRYLTLQAQKRGEVTDELRDALADNVPVVFGTVLVLTIPILAALAIFKPS